MRKLSERLHLQATAIDALAEGVHWNGRVVACHLGDYVWKRGDTWHIFMTRSSSFFVCDIPP